MHVAVCVAVGDRNGAVCTEGDVGRMAEGAAGRVARAEPRKGPSVEVEADDFVRVAVDWDGTRHFCEAVHVDVRGITSSNGDQQRRFVIKTPLAIGSLTFRAEISLADRSQMQFPMLIGRTALRRRMVVDSGHSWLQSPAIAHKGRVRR
jgi:hypothetical protein